MDHSVRGCERNKLVARCVVWGCTPLVLVLRMIHSGVIHEIPPQPAVWGVKTGWVISRAGERTPPTESLVLIRLCPNAYGRYCLP